MKVFVLLTIAICAVTASLTQEEIAEKWATFKTTHNKVYKNHNEEVFRKQIFLKNLQRIEEHNARYNQRLETYEMGINKFSDFTKDELRPYTHGLIMPETEPKPLYQITSRTSLGLSEDSEIPSSLDWRDQGVVTEVKDQGDCGACWAFSSTGSIESQVKIANGSNTNVLLSEQQLVDCVTDNYGCEGGWMPSAFDYVIQAGGIDSEDAYPYLGTDGTCHYYPDKAIARIHGYTRLAKADEGLLADMVATKGPVSLAIDATDDNFWSYKDGVYYNPDCETALFTHAVLVVGYGTENGQDYWLVKNSYGENWGLDGYIKMSRNRNNNCGIATLAVIPVL